MQFNDYISKVQPKGRRSQLWPLSVEILEMERLDYAYWQIVNWLQMCGIDVSLESLKEFIEIAKKPKMLRA